MLLQNGVSVEKDSPRRWSRWVAGGLLGLAIVGGGIGFRAMAAPAPEKKAAPKDQSKDGADVKKQDQRPMLPHGALPPEFEEIFKNFPHHDGDFGDIQKQMEQAREQLRKAMDRGGRPGHFGFARPMTPPRLGVHVEKPSVTLADQLDLPADQGLIIVDVMPDSAAAKAGLKPHDVLLELEGKPVSTDVAQFHKHVAAIKADTKVDAVVLRKGRKETVKGLSLPAVKPIAEARAVPALPRLKNPAVAGEGRKGVNQTSIVRTNDEFTAKQRTGDHTITVTGKLADDQTTVNEITIQDGKETHRYDSVDKVPEAQREKVKALLDMANKGEARP